MRLAVVVLALLVAGCSRHHEPSLMHLIDIDKAGTPPEPVVLSRQSRIDTFPCGRCHKVPLAQMKHDGKNGKPRAHWGLELKHSTEAVIKCSTCHLEQDFNSLRTLQAQPVSFEASQQVCAQCHSRQASDWKGGAHGKRVGGWDGPRIAKTCVECHNPHKPAWDKRWPARLAVNKE